MALQAVLFVRDLDRGLLGRGSHGLQQYEMLRRGTDALVNGILRVRRLLKQKRTADADGMPGPSCTDGMALSVHSLACSCPSSQTIKWHSSTPVLVSQQNTPFLLRLITTS